MSVEALHRHRNQAEVQWVGMHRLCEGSMRSKELKVRTPVLRVGDALQEVERGTALSRVEDPVPPTLGESASRLVPLADLLGVDMAVQSAKDKGADAKGSRYRRL